MASKPETKRLSIRKYSNRRFYDATRSCHVTLAELYDLICAGHELTITDARTGDDITNQVLTQIILERDTGKLEMFPSNILHQMIRTQQQFLGGVVEQYFRQVLETQRQSQERWAEFLRNTFGAAAPNPVNPMDWARGFWQSVGAPSPPNASAPPPAAPPAAPTSQPRRDNEIEELRRRLEELERRLNR